MKIKEIRVASPQEWDDIVNKSNYSTYFHSREWYDIWKQYSPGSNSPYPLLFSFEDNTRLIVPLAIDNENKYLKKYISSPAGTYGGWIAASDLTIEHINAVVEHLLKVSDSLILRINPYHLAPSDLQGFVKDDITNTLPLEKGIDEIFKTWTKGHKSAVTKALKSGVTIEKASSQEDWKAYYQLYKDSIRRWGDKASSNYDWSLFETMFQANSKDIVLWMAKFEKKPIAGALCFYKNQHIVYWHGAADDDYFTFRPVNLLIYEVIKDGCLNKFRWFDFNPSGGHEGVRAFKRSFGTIEMSCPVIRYKSRKLLALAFLRQKYRGVRKRIKNNIVGRTKRVFLNKVEEGLINIKKKDLKYPPIFVVGTLRSGTTVIYQYLNYFYKFSYFPNVARGKNSLHPYLSTYVSGAYKEFVPTFKSSYGDIEGESSPSDGWEIFHRWFSYYMNPAKTSPVYKKELKSLVSVFESLYDAPFINKNNSNTLRVLELKDLFPEALFINVKRNIYDTIASVIEGRKKNNISPDKFWSVAPEMELLDITFENELDLLVFQYLFNNRFVDEVYKKGLIKNLVNIDYDEFCRNQELLIKLLEKNYNTSFLKRREAQDGEKIVSKPSKINQLKEKIDPYIEKNEKIVKDLIIKMLETIYL